MKFKHGMVREVVDCNTGEVKKVETSKVYTTRIKNEKQFYQTFIGFAAAQRNIKNIKTIYLLTELCEMASYNNGSITLSPVKRDYLCNTIKFDKAALSKALKQLVELKILSGKRGEYILSPEFFWKGDTLTREEFIKDKEIQISFNLNIPEKYKDDKVEFLD